MKDVTSREDVELLVRSFYTKVRKNETLGYIFDEVIRIDWEYHIPILVDFWETILLDTTSYRRNAMAEHFKVNEKVRLEPMHFSIWLDLFDQTIDELFRGEKAELAKKRAHSIAQLMQLKMQQINKTHNQ
ncbi:MAG TPA: group III truncated hemoglobin [Chitinophagaceae bacterium]|nr:group III truncated hemoglobin [Chitinophagaceae bacterium]